MKKIQVIILIIFLLILFSGCGRRQISQSDSNIKNMPNLSSKKALLIIAFRDYQDKEYDPIRQILENAGIKTITASSQKGEAVSVSGKIVPVDLALGQVNVADYDAIIFIGGAGAVEYQENSLAHQIIKDALAQNKILAAICIAPTILAKAGVLQNKQATVWSSPAYRSTIDILKQNGAKFVNQKVVSDGNIITGNGPEAAQEFGERIANEINK